MKFILPVLVVGILIIGGAYLVFSKPVSLEQESPMNGTSEGAHEVTAGVYSVVGEESTITFAGKKPLIEGYINAGSLSVTKGNITVEDEKASGEFIIDMNTLRVTATPTKPGKESALEGHLKSDRWFDVEAFPTATFVITNVTRTAESETTFTYEVTGDLTMKGKTHEVMFPATIYQSPDGTVIASASFTIDRTLWGITSGSGTFFDDLADNVIDDMVSLSFSLTARGQ
jgi:polyisoprenoid-binding protein YceI